MHVDVTLVLLMLSGYEGSVNLTKINYIASTTTFSYEKVSFFLIGVTNCSFLEKGISKNGIHTRLLKHTSSLSNPSTNSPLVEGVHCFSFILISPSPLFKIHIRFSLSWLQSEPLKQSITLLMLFVSPDLSLSMESTPLSWSGVGERQTLTWGNCFVLQAVLTPSPLRKSALCWIRALS